MPTCCIAAGGNLGDVAETLRSAWQMLAAIPGIAALKPSHLYRTVPIGEHAGDVFLNAACRLETTLPALEILDHLRAIETHFGRTRGVCWGPRTIDLDLILYGQNIIRLPQLSVPHPAAWYRRFVLDPLVEIAGELTHPVHRQTFRRLHEQLAARPLKVALGPLEVDEGATMSSLRQQLQAVFPQVEITDLEAAHQAYLVITGTVGAYDLRDGWLQQTSPLRLVDSAERPARSFHDVYHILLSATDSPERISEPGENPS